MWKRTEGIVYRGMGDSDEKLEGVKYPPPHRTQPLTQPPDPDLLTWTPYPSDLKPLPIWPEPPANLNLRPCDLRPCPSDPTHFSSLYPLPHTPSVIPPDGVCN